MRSILNTNVLIFKDVAGMSETASHSSQIFAISTINWTYSYDKTKVNIIMVKLRMLFKILISILTSENFIQFINLRGFSLYSCLDEKIVERSLTSLLMTQFLNIGKILGDYLPYLKVIFIEMFSKSRQNITSKIEVHCRFAKSSHLRTIVLIYKDSPIIKTFQASLYLGSVSTCLNHESTNSTHM